jgi:hypothetical protein
LIWGPKRPDPWLLKPVLMPPAPAKTPSVVSACEIPEPAPEPEIVPDPTPPAEPKEFLPEEEPPPELVPEPILDPVPMVVPVPFSVPPALESMLRAPLAEPMPPVGPAGTA